MNFDLRFPVGLMFTIFGLILTGVGLVGGTAMYQTTSLGINMNLWWGLVLLVFGLFMLMMAIRGKGKKS
ncbi:MAG: hypothetical protein ABSE62_16415 [Chthoniobacteraceae bacterium]|jgi:hypothetical protein